MSTHRAQESLLARLVHFLEERRWWPFEEDDPPPRAPRVAVYGMTHTGLNDAVVAACTAAGLPIDEEWIALPDRPAGDLCVVLFDVTKDLAHARLELRHDIEILAHREDGPGPRLVYVWVVPTTERLGNALVYGGDYRWDNLTDLFLARSWGDQLAATPDPAVAVHTQHERLLRLATSSSHQQVGGYHVGEIYGHLQRIDPDHVVCLCAQALDGSDRWNNVDAILAAAGHRWSDQQVAPATQETG